MTTSLSGKHYIITGSSSGIGKVAALELAKQGAAVTLACRSRSKTEPVIAEIKQAAGNDQVYFLELDLSDLAQVRRAAAEQLATGRPIHGLINNAGLASTRGTTKDGFELAFGTNHLGHYLFTRLLLDRIVQTPGARIVNVSSDSHYQAKAVDWDTVQKKTGSVTGLPEYAVSKLANVLFTKELARRLEGTGVTTYALHPGVVATDVWRRMPRPIAWLAKKLFMITPEQGAVATLRTATAPELASETGRYYRPDGKEKRPSKLADDAGLAKLLWDKSAAWTGLGEDLAARSAPAASGTAAAHASAGN